MARANVKVNQSLPPASSNSGRQTIVHQIPPVWNEHSRVLILGTMPSPKSRAAGFFYMHPQNRFWRVLPAVFGETLALPNNPSGSCNFGIPTNPRVSNNSSGATNSSMSTNLSAAISERRQFLLDHKIALWDVLASCDIQGAADSSIKNAVPNDFAKIFGLAKIRRVFCAGKTAFALWKKFCAPLYEARFGIEAECLPSPSPANASWSFERLLSEWARVKDWT